MKTIILIAALSGTVFLTNYWLLPAKPAESSFTNAKFPSSVEIVNGMYTFNRNSLSDKQHKLSLLSELDKAQLQEKKSVADIPHFILDFLKCTTNEGVFKLAEANRQWDDAKVSMGDVKKYYDPIKKDTVVVVSMNGILPERQFKYFAMGDGMALLSYYVGRYDRGQEMTIIKFKGEKVTDCWTYTSRDFMDTKGEMVKYLRSDHINAGGC